MRFGDLLKATVFASAGAATALALITVVGASRANQSLLVPVVAGWWVVAAALGLFIGRRRSTNPGIGRLLAGARSATSLPEQAAGTVLLNRLWPLLLASLVAGAAGLFAPQIPGIACGFAMLWALSWRHQEQAVTAIEERDGAAFFVEKTSPLRPITLVRTPGFRRGKVAPAKAA